MALTKAERIEIQEAAKFNHMRRLRAQQEEQELEQAVAEKVAESTKPQKKTEKKESK